MEGEVIRSFGYLGIKGRTQVAYKRSREITSTEYIKFTNSLCKARSWCSDKFAGDVPGVVAMVTDSVGRLPRNKLSMSSEVCRSRVEAVVVGPDASEG